MIEELDYVEEIIFGVLMGCGAHGPEILLPYRKQHFEFNIANIARDRADIDTGKAESLVKIPFLFKLSEHTNEQFDDVT